jgi:hypothetical protein
MGSIDTLVQDTIAALKELRGDVEATKSALWQYFRKGLEANISVEELDMHFLEILPKVGYNAEQFRRV